MPRSILLGRTPERGEPIWLDEDRASAIAWAEYQLDLHECGQPLSETTAMKRDEFGRRIPAHDYEVDSWYCEGCRVLAAERKRMSDDPDSHAVVYAVRRTD